MRNAWRVICGVLFLSAVLMFTGCGGSNTPPTALALTAPSTTGGVTGKAYSAAFTSTGGTGTINWTATGLPAGLALSATTGSTVNITGTPTTAAAASSVTVTATDSGTGTNLQTKSSTISITIAPAMVVSVAAAFPSGITTKAYVQGSTSFQATAGTPPYTWAVTGLPAGLSVPNPATTTSGVSLQISGTPTGSGANTVSYTVTDSGSGGTQQTSTATFSLPVIPKLSITTVALPNAVVNSAYTATLASTGGTGAVTWAATGLPSGLALNSATGAISGTLTSTTGSPFTVNITATDSGSAGSTQQTATTTLSFSALPVLTVPSTPLPVATIGVAYNATVPASGGVPPYTFTTTGLPLGLSLNATTGVISGTPTTSAGSSRAAAPGNVFSNTNYSITVTDSGTPQQTSTVSLGMTVNAGTPVITTTTLPSATVNVAYSQTLAYNNAGETGTPTWAITSGSLTGSGLSFNTASGVISGTPSSVGGPYSISVTVTANSVTSAAQALSVSVLPTLAVTTATLPNAFVGLAYSTNLAASGGTGSGYTWTVQSGSATLTLLGLTLDSTGLLHGTPTAPGTGSVTFLVTDSGSHTATASLTITGYNQLSLPAANPSSLGAGSNTGPYTGSITATGGVPPYTWTVNSTSVATNSTPLSLSGGLGLSVNNNGNATLNVSGTPSSTGTVSFTAAVKDSNNTTVGPTTYTIAVSTTYSFSGTVNQTNGCSSTPVAGVTVTLGGAGSATTTTNSNGQYTFTGLAANSGPYTVTPSVSGPTETLFVPGVRNPSIVTSNISGGNFVLETGYNVSGTATYAGSKTGPVYVTLTNTNGSCGNTTPGTGIPALVSGSGAFTIRGVLPGTYSVSAWMDTLGLAQQNLNDPSGNSVSNVTVASSNVTTAAVTLTDPAAINLAGITPSLQGAAPFSGGALVIYGAVSNNNKVEEATSYTLQWSTDLGFGTIVGSKTFQATGANGTNVWIVNGLTNGTAYYFRYFGSNGTNTLTSAISGPYTPAAPSGTATVSGTVSYPGITPPANSTLYVGFIDQNNHIFNIAPYPNPASGSQAYSMSIAPDSNYAMVAILDNNNNGVIDLGDISNTSKLNTLTPVTASATGVNLTLVTTNSAAQIYTQHFQTNGTNDNYTVNFNVYGVVRPPVSVAVTAGKNILVPMDIGLCTNCGGSGYNFSNGYFGASPTVGDTYTIAVGYTSGITADSLTPSVGAVLGSGAFATGLSPSGSTSNLKPTFTWTYPTGSVCTGSNVCNYSFYLQAQNGGNTIWQIPGNNSDNNSFTPLQVPVPAGIPWNTDPTGNNNLPNNPYGSAGLNAATTYLWQISTMDANNNQAIAQVTFVP